MDLITPTREELAFTKELHHNPNTMRFQHHIDEISDAQLDELYQLITLDHQDTFLYRHVYCDSCGFMTGEAGWKKENDRHYIFITIAYDLRNEGFGTSALNDLITLAKQNNISKLYVKLSKDNPYLSFFEKRHFICIEQESDTNIYALFIES